MKRPDWIARAQIVEVHDGDTFKAQLDLGWRLSLTTYIRLAGVNAPELPTPSGIAAQLYLMSLLKVGDVVTIRSSRLDKYGRSQAFVTMADGRDVGSLMLQTGHGLSVNSSLQPAPYNVPEDLPDLPDYGEHPL
jgi:endonuclease YncB( thermonuclease family)